MERSVLSIVTWCVDWDPGADAADFVGGRRGGVVAGAVGSGPRDVAVVTVRYNTRELTALLLWSLRTIVNWPDLEIVVVDNGSAEGSAELLAEAAQAGICVLLANGVNRQHGPGLNQGISWLAARRGPLPAWIWILDSDVVAARPDALSAALAVARARSAALVGEPRWDPSATRSRASGCTRCSWTRPCLATAKNRAVRRRRRSVVRSVHLGRTARHPHGRLPVHRRGSRHSPWPEQPCLGLCRR